MRILHFVSTPATWSGVMRVIMNYYRHIDRSKIQFDFLCFAPCEQSFEQEIKALGGQVFFVPKPGSSLHTFREIKKFFDKYGSRYQVFHNHEVYLSFYLAPLAKKAGISRFIIHSHATRYSDKKMSAIRNSVLCTPIRFMKCEKFSCSSDAGKFLFGKKTFENGEVNVLHNAIALNAYEFNPESRKEIRNNDQLESNFVIGHVGRFMPQKNHMFMLEVLARLLPDMPEAKLLLIGDGPLRQSVQNRCLELGIENQVQFIGQREDVEKWYSAMDLFILPSIYEGLGNAMLEAQANGLTCIVSDQVPLEAQVAADTVFLPLQVDVWVKEIRAKRQKMRTHTLANRNMIEENFNNARYNIKTESVWLQEYYENTNTHVCL